MHISKVKIQNFRNFNNFEADLSQNAILLGENGVGKSNFIYALRMVLDKSFRFQIEDGDFHRGFEGLQFRGAEIQIDVFFKDFTSEKDEDVFAVFRGDCYCQDNPPIAQISFKYSPKEIYLKEVSKATGSDYYKSVWYGGGNVDNEEAANVLRKHINLKVIHALRDIDNDLSAWQRSPLRRLTKAMKLKDEPKFQEVSKNVKDATKTLQDIDPIKALQKDIQSRLSQMIEGVHNFDPKIGLLPSEPDELQKHLTFLVENDLSLNRTSLGLANILHLTLSMVEIELLRKSKGEEEDYQYTIVAIEEPEAHLHPHIQRLVFKDFLEQSSLPVIISTHSPNITSISDPDWFVNLIKKEGASIAKSTAAIKSWNEDLKTDLKRFLNLNRGEVVFAKGVILVEGDAEAFLIPEFARLMHKNDLIPSSLDGMGVSVLNVSGTDFVPYVRFLGPEGLNLPLAVVTDGDCFVGLTKAAGELLESLSPSDSRRESLKRALDEKNLNSLRKELEVSFNLFMHFGLKRAVDLYEQVALKSKQAVHRNQFDAIESLYASGNWNRLRSMLKTLDVGVFVNEWTLEDELLKVGYIKEFMQVYEELGASNTQAKNMKKQFDENEIKKIISRIEESGKGKGRFAQRLSDKLVFEKIPPYISEAIHHVSMRVAKSSIPVSTRVTPPREE